MLVNSNHHLGNSGQIQDRVELGLGVLQSLDRVQDSNLRVLIFTATYFVLDGVTLTIRRLESHLRAKGATVKIVSTVPEKINPSELQNVIVVPGIKIPFNHAGDYSFGVGLDENTIADIERFNPNIVHFTVPDFVALDGIRWCQRNNIAYIGTWHSNYCEYLKYYFLEWILGSGLNRYLRGFFEQIPTVYVPTPYMLKKMREEWGYGIATELKEWGRGVDMSLFTPDKRSIAFRSSKGISDSDIVVLWVSRIVPEKRPEVWFHVVKRLQDEGYPVKPLVVGSGTFERNFSTLKDVTCCGWLSGAALAEAYASSDILLFPSDVETFGNVTLEALSSGCPAVVERKCGEHLVENGVNGLTCPAGDSEAFYEATKKLVVNEVLRKQMGVAARQKAAVYERSIILQQMAENYKDAIVKHKDPQFLKKHLQNPEGAGRNILSVLCCNYSFIKVVAEPFLNTSRGVQDMVENTADCVQATRTRLSCTDFLSSANLTALASTSEDLESGLSDSRRYESRGKKGAKGKPSYCASCVSFLGGSLSAVTAGRIFHWFGIIVALGIVFLFVYASFTV